MKEVLQKYNIHPSKFYGQNFLINKGIIEKIISAADLSKKDTVLEIGPGLGVLTEELIKYAGKVIAIEKDKKLYKLLKDRFKDAQNLDLINKDILFYNLQPTTYKLIANIPYNITGKILRKFLSRDNPPKMVVVMVQREVGEKLLGKKSKSMLSLITELYGNVERICNVSAGSFFPKPKVDSMVIKLTIGYPVTDSIHKGVLKIAKIGFSNKRKKLLTNLSTGLKIDKKILKNIFEKISLNENVRAEELLKEDWLKLAKKILK